MPSFRPRLLLAAVLLASLALAALPRPAACQEVTAAAPNATPTANATNATEWVIPPEVEALFPKDAVFDEKLWKTYSTSPLSRDDLRSKRIHRKFRGGTYEGVCKDYHKNLELWGGEFQYGCITAPIHPSLLNKKLIRPIEWESVEPRLHVDVIREYYIAELRQDRIYHPGKHANDDEYNWRRMSPLIKKMLITNGIVMQRASLDIDNDGFDEEVYRFNNIISRCFRPDGSESHRFKYCMMENNNLKNEFNSGLSRHYVEPIIYNETTYWVSDTNITIIKLLLTKDNIWNVEFVRVCDLFHIY